MFLRSRELPNKLTLTIRGQPTELTPNPYPRSKSSSRGISFEAIVGRLRNSHEDLVQDDVMKVRECLEGIGLIHTVVGSDKDSLPTSTVVSWWESAATDGAGVSYSSLKNKMSLLVREEAKLDVWLSRLRDLQPAFGRATDVYVTPSDIRHSATVSGDPSNTEGKEGSDVGRKQPMVVIHAPFGSTVQMSQATGTDEGNGFQGLDGDEDARSNSAPLRKRKVDQLMVSSKRQVVQNRRNDSDSVRHPSRTQPAPQVQVYFLADGEDNGQLRSMHDHPVMKLVEEPAYVSIEVQRRLTASVGDDKYHVSCLRPTEGASSFF
jgi:hypothetical protein